MALTSSMACRVFRNLRLQGIHEKESFSSTTISNPGFVARSYTQRFILDTGETRSAAPTLSECATTGSIEMGDVSFHGRSNEQRITETVIPARRTMVDFPGGIGCTKSLPKLD